MTNGEESGQKRRPWLRALLAAIAVLLLALFGPPLISINRYKGQITNLVSRSLGRPVHLSSVEARLLPWPGFVLYDLSVAEDPAYGAEPVLHANQVTASLRILPLLVGRPEIATISVDEASLNVVRAGPGRWNLDTLFRTAAAQAGGRAGADSGAPVRLPTFEATDSRVDFKNGVEKLPFSLVDADMTVWQENPGEWRIRLRGQPARTDVSMYLEDTGVVRMEASVRRAPALREMPVHLDLDWRQAQLGQLARLVTGSDSGWRGDLTGELHLDGTADAAHVTTRLRASGVHREEFVPVSPLDFDANCSLLFHYTERSVENVLCDSPIGDGRVRLTGDKPGNDAPPTFTVELNRVPVEAGLDVLRTLRSGLQPDLAAAGTVSGKLEYAERNTAGARPATREKPTGPHRARAAEEEAGPLTGGLTVENLVLTGGGLKRPIQTARIGLAPATWAATRVQAGQGEAAVAGPADDIAGTVAIPAGGATPLVLSLRFSLAGYQIGAHGQASIVRAREIAQAAGIPATAALASLAGDPIAVDLVAQGPWLPAEVIAMGEAAPPETAAASQADKSPAAGTPVSLTTDTLTGTVSVHNANWRADYLANHLQISEATLHLEEGSLRWDPMEFSYGPVKGTATLTLAEGCGQQEGPLCVAELEPSFHVAFGDLDAASVETALLGARERGTLLSTLIERLHPSTAPPWPKMQGTVTASSLALGPVKLEKIKAELEILPDGAEVMGLNAGLLGGSVSLTGTLLKPATDQDKPAYSLTADFENVDAKALGQLLGLRWTGSSVSGNGKVDLAGYTDAELAESAKGRLHIETRIGAIGWPAKAQTEGEPGADEVPGALARFERLTADAVIANGVVTLGQNQIVLAGRKRSVAATVTITDPPEVSFEATKPSVAKR